ncbi:hypothetical protein SDC9_146608 [bioreactor metagenome]|uniref:Teneurin-like YD-shell domain-containing protein n=1 Tax=bioreactor metagenome TaxID=1076179 RepID=A0A645EBR1_9ZZZZ
MPLTLKIGNDVYYYHTDANKNITDLTDVTGASVAHYQYSPFGQLTAATGTLAEVNPFRFSSEYYDSETNLVYYNYRYYNPQFGRWLSRDPIEEQGGWNLYEITSNNTLTFFDTKGLEMTDGKIHGNWVGGGYSGGETDKQRKGKPINWSCPAIDRIDAAAKTHDACYVKCEDGIDPLTKCKKPKTQNESDCKKDCDKELVKAAEAILGDIYYTPSAKENYLAGMIRDWFSK